MSYWQYDPGCRICGVQFPPEDMVQPRRRYCKFCISRYHRFRRLAKKVGRTWRMGDMHRCRNEWRKVSEI